MEKAMKKKRFEISEDVTLVYYAGGQNIIEVNSKGAIKFTSPGTIALTFDEIKHLYDKMLSLYHSAEHEELAWQKLQNAHAITNIKIKSMDAIIAFITMLQNQIMAMVGGDARFVLP